MRRNPIRPWDHGRSTSEPNVSTVENPISARSAEEVASVSTGGNGVNARSVEEQRLMSARAGAE